MALFNAPRYGIRVILLSIRDKEQSVKTSYATVFREEREDLPQSYTQHLFCKSASPKPISGNRNRFPLEPTIIYVCPPFGSFAAMIFLTF